MVGAEGLLAACVVVYFCQVRIRPFVPFVFLPVLPPLGVS